MNALEIVWHVVDLVMLTVHIWNGIRKTEYGGIETHASADLRVLRSWWRKTTRKTNVER